MKAQLLTTATFLTTLAGVLPAADPVLLNLVSPDAKVLAGVNVQQGKGTLFGQYVLNQMQSSITGMQQLIALTGFDPTRDVNETLVASTGAPETGLALARGNFDIGKLTAAASLKGAVSEAYNSVNILEDPKQKHGVAFLDSTTAVAGDVASVKGAIDRQKSPQPLPSGVTVKISQLSASQDAWALSTVPPSSLAPPAAAAHNGQIPPVLQTVQSASGGVKFGANVVFTGQAQTDTAQNATTLGDTIKLLISLAQMNAGQNQQAAQLAQQVQVTASGNVVTVSLSLPEDQFQQLVKIGQKSGAMSGPRRAIRESSPRK
ncbi:MAG TPA: hypothetical protein VNY05_42885 [Candidatus Acidoferrales bacterium]|jgi:hypothetical protein|nr:hypothetical protein [Candidatus Acidoferrales bacterium]